jgi:ABC-type uncharacterized transport system involved in gliding motility auxiliary subunit
MKLAWMKTRQTRVGASAGLYVVLVIAVLATVNWLASRHVKSLDTTSNKRYSLSDQTIKIVKGLKEDVTVTYFGETMEFPRARDLLSRYGNLSPKFKVTYVDPQKRPRLAREAGITTAPTILVQAGARRQEARNLSEEDVTSALVRALKTGNRAVCFTTGSGESSIEESGPTGLSVAKEQLEKENYTTRTVEFVEKTEIPGDCVVVVVAGPRGEISQAGADALGKYIGGGGRALIMLDPPLSLRRSSISPNEPVSKLLSGYGVTPQKNLILTTGMEAIQGLGSEVALAREFTSHPIAREMKNMAVAFPLSQSFEVKPVASNNAEKLASTSPRSLAVTNLSAELSEKDVSAGKVGSHAVSAAVEVRGGEGGKSGRVVVSGSSGFAANAGLRYLGNRDLFMNMVNWLSSDEDLISIRPKDPEDRRIQLSRAQMTLLRLTSQFLIPIAVIFAGVFVWWRRR